MYPHQGRESSALRQPDPNNQPKDRKFEAVLKRMKRPETSADVLVPLVIDVFLFPNPINRNLIPIPEYLHERAKQHLEVESFSDSGDNEVNRPPRQVSIMSSASSS
jgi:hypothetical protein